LQYGVRRYYRFGRKPPHQIERQEVDTPTNSPVRFGVFELDARTGELRRSGHRVALQPQPFEILRALLERPGEVVTREELRGRLWSNGAYVDFDHSLNKAIGKLRDALGDDADSPRYIETLPRHGYRFIPLPQANAHLDVASPAQGALTAAVPQPEGPASPQLSSVSGVQSADARHGWRWAAVGLPLLALVGWLISNWFRMEAPSPPALPLNLTPAVAVAFAPPPHSIAVLPFVNMSGDPNQEYFSDGLTEELLNSLSRINELQVAARTSSFYFRGEHADLSTIAHKLNVASVLEGSVRRSGNTLRITAQLNNAVTGFHLWSQTYDRDISDVLKLQTEIATAVASALKITLLADEAGRIGLGGTSNPAAFDAYLRALRTYISRHDVTEIPTAISAYTEAIRLDPTFALAYAGRAEALSQYTQELSTGVAAREGLARAETDARHAITLAPELAQAHLALGYVFEGRLDFERASQEYERARALAPGAAKVLAMSGNFALLMGKTNEALTAFRYAAVLDPLGHVPLASALYLARRYEEAVAAFTETIRLAPDYKYSYAGRGLALYALGDLQSARASCEIHPDIWASQRCLSIVYDKLGRHSDAQVALAKFKSAWGEDYGYEYATIYAQWGDRTKALELLEKAVRVRNAGLCFLKIDPLLDPLRKEPRFQAVMRELKFPN
jgi:TolB-like protein/DNA-binding winged helix-turn-helix (wHTH) protein/Flp pilus assembly protein TadD